MKGFYDKIVPDFLNKLGKAYKMKVTSTVIDPNTHGSSRIQVPYFPITDQMRKDLLEKGQARYGRSGMKRRYAAPITQSLSDAMANTTSTNQGSITAVGKDIAQELRLLPAQGVDAIHQTPQGARPSMLLTLNHAGNVPKAVYAGSWFGLMTQQPGVVVFNPGPGKDLLHRFRSGLSGKELVGALRSIGVNDSTLVPKRQGVEAVVFDRDAKMGAALQQLAHSVNGNLQSTRGNGNFVGALDQKDARAAYRNVIRTYEARQSQTPQQMSRNGEKRRYAAPYEHPLVTKWLSVQPPSQQHRKSFADSLHVVLSVLSPQAIKGIGHLHHIKVFPNHRTLVDHYSSLTGGQGNPNSTGAFYFPGDPKLSHPPHIAMYEGERPMMTLHKTAHEMFHVVDHGDRYSADPEWIKAWRKEIVPPMGPGIWPLTGYAASKPWEGFAEAGRLATVKPSAILQLPLVHQFLKDRGILRDTDEDDGNEKKQMARKQPQQLLPELFVAGGRKNGIMWDATKDDLSEPAKRAMRSKSPMQQLKRRRQRAK